jgi:hypothetical protein
VLEAFLLHERAGFFTADAAGAEHDDGLVLQLCGELADGVGEVAELRERQGEGVLESAELDFVVVAGVKQGDGAAFIEPLFEFGRLELGGGAAGGVDAVDAEGDDLLFEADEHAIVGLVIAGVVLAVEGLEAWQGADFGEQTGDRVGHPRDEEVKTFLADEDGAFEGEVGADLLEALAQGAEVAEGGEAVGGEVGEGGVQGGDGGGGWDVHEGQGNWVVGKVRGIPRLHPNDLNTMTRSEVRKR